VGGATYNSVLNAFFAWKVNGAVQRLGGVAPQR
jgi:hypothetical protein